MPNTQPKKIMVIDDERRHRELYTSALKDADFEVISFTSATEALVAIDKIQPNMIISDVKMPGMDGFTFLQKVREKDKELPFLLITAFGDIKDAVQALKLGAVDYLEKPIDFDELRVAVRDALHISYDEYQSDIPKELLEDVIAESPVMRSILENAYRVAQSEATVLLTGESGTGKEVMASFIHRASHRAKNSFVALNCAAIPANILASELFGHKKGAFTGAAAHRNGIFLESNGGTLFLDEIGDMPIELQPSILRAIETGRVSPVGSDKEIKVDFRLIAATNANLLKSVEDGKFRIDLYYRLNVISFELPPLRERKEDIIPMAHFFLARKGFKEKRFSQAASLLMMNYSWPGNARELANAVERASIISNTDIILPEHLPPVIVNSKKENHPAVATNSNSEVKTMEELELEGIRNALLKVDGNRTKAAQLLGISRRALIYKIKRYNL
jgi:DNA-binding NtrC family response regulator